MCAPDAPTPLAALRAELTGEDTCTARAITVRGFAPVLALCRRLVAAGHNPKTPLEVYRGPILCLHVRAIGEVAGLDIAGKGIGFKRRAVGSASHTRKNGRSLPEPARRYLSAGSTATTAAAVTP